MPSRTRSCGRHRVTSRPSKTTEPAVAGSTPMIVFSRVVLPTPLRPITHTSRPGSTSSETSNSTRAEPYPAHNRSTDSIPGLLPRPAEIDRLDPRIGPHLVHRPLGQHPSLVQHRDPRG